MTTLVHVLFIHVISPVPDGPGKTPHFQIACSLTVEALSKT